MWRGQCSGGSPALLLLLLLGFELAAELAAAHAERLLG